jgi:sugar lactone lactonase YvrE
VRLWKAYSVAETRNVLGESPVWRSEDGKLFWVDVRQASLHSFSPDTGRTSHFRVNDGTMGVVLDAKGQLIVAARDCLVRVQEDGAVTQTHWRFALPDASHRLNEAKCDQTGAFWCGTMRDFGLAPTGSLFRLGADGGFQIIRRNVTVPNSLDFSPDLRWVYFADTRSGVIERAHYDVRTGALGEWMPFIPADAAPGRPDGVAMDSDGYLWNARFGGGCVARFDPSGRLAGIVKLEVSRPTSCTFGGPSLTTLYIVSARQGLNDDQLRDEPLAGALFACEVSSVGLPSSRLNIGEGGLHSRTG